MDAALPESLKHEFSLEELEQMKQQFTDFDTSGDGSIAASELIVLMESMGITTALEEVPELIDKVDENRSGELEYPEFVRSMSFGNQLVSDIRRGDGDKLAIFLQYSKHVMAIRRELLDLNTQPTLNSQAFGVKENAWEWKVLIRGPPGSPYEDGVFNFYVRFGHEYPFEPPVFSCLTRIYHPNFVPKLLATPDEELITEFQAETAEMLLGGGVATQSAVTAIIATSKSKAARHPRVIVLECIAAYRNDRDTFNRDARKLTLQCAVTSPVAIDFRLTGSTIGESTIMLAQQQEVEADVRKEDQLRINEFGRNNAALHEIREQKKALKDKLDTLDDANTDLMMGEGDNVQLFIGESFVEASEDFAQEYLEKRVEEANDKLKKLQAEESKLEARQAVRTN
ncbi:EF-Hand 1, calcium-binding site [Phytophthora cactorum]|nr:EF-Hand 1, calcium-binding site [Phytophthora cactorum]